MTVSAFSAFSGAGAVLLGEWLGWKHVGACDRDAFCRAVINHRLPDVPTFDDMAAVPWESAWSDCSPAAGRASLTASPASDSPEPTSATAGRFCSTPFAVVDPISRSSRTSQESFLPTAEDIGGGSSPIWPASGSMRNGWCWEQAMPSSSPAAIIDDSDCGSSLGDETWPTPCAHTHARGPGNTLSDRHHKPHDLETAVRTWPTPCATDAASAASAASAANRTSGRTNPDSTHHDGLTLLDAVRLSHDESGCPTSPTDQPISSDAGETLWQTPLASDASKGGLTFGRGNLTLKGQVAQWPTPNATASNDGETRETWEARRAQVLSTGINGNGMGMPLSIAVQKAGETGTKLNPEWVAAILGWPPKWTGLPAADIAQARRACRSPRGRLRALRRISSAETSNSAPSATAGISPAPSLPGTNSSDEPASTACPKGPDA